MIKKSVILSLFIVLWNFSTVAAQKEKNTTKSVFSGVQLLEQYTCPEWFRDAKFGIWSHWGPASIPGISNGFPQEMYQQDSPAYKWMLEHFGHPSRFGYKDLIESWKAEMFDPDALMAKYKAAGAKYFFALATHHDNFDCFDSPHHEWNSVKHGPKKDIVGLWREAAVKVGLYFGVSSHADDRGWNYMYGARLSDKTGPKAGVTYDGANPAYRALYNDIKEPKEKPSTAWYEEWYQRHIDLVDKYKPDALYFDGGVPHGEYGKKLVAHYLDANRTAHGGKMEAVVNVKDNLYVLDYERGANTIIGDKPWQDDTSLAGWFYVNNNPKNDMHSLPKDAATVIHTLADVVSKNGNLLINMPQRGDGSLYPECEKVLDELAKWMPINGEAIFGTRPWLTFGEGPTQLPEAKHMNELKKPLTWQDVRFTTKGDFLYIIVCGIPQGPLQIKALGRLGRSFSSIGLLGSQEKVQYQKAWEGLTIMPVKEWPCQYAVVYKIRFFK